jgi:hypothetical protein
MKVLVLLSLLLLTGRHFTNAAEPDRPFSGPQPGETTTPFRVLNVTPPSEGEERDPIRENAGAATALVFLHTIERSLVPLLRVVDQYGATQKQQLKTEVVFLHKDRLEGQQRIKAAAGSIRLQSRVGLSLEGAEGPGNYGLNKECMMTIVVAKDNKVTANFALTQPGIADAPKVIEALARVCGDNNPPTVDQLAASAGPRGAARDRGSRMQRDREKMDGPDAQTVDFSKLDLNSEAGLRDAVRALIAEVLRLRSEITQLRGGETSSRRAEDRASKPKEGFPGAVPTDGKLNSLLRQCIRPTNDVATVDRLFVEMEAHIKDNPDLTQQAIDGWTRVLHFGDHYGTAYARKLGAETLERLNQAQIRPAKAE